MKHEIATPKIHIQILTAKGSKFAFGPVFHKPFGDCMGFPSPVI
jgi:hypothetical protein